MTEASGAQWCARYPTSVSLDDLVQPFQGGLESFIAALRAAGASVTVSATHRPKERAYLMHWCCRIAAGEDPKLAPAMSGVAIDWTHGGNRAAAVAAAKAMKAGYGIAYPAALVSRHTQRRAADMTVRWTGTIRVRDAHGVQVPCTQQKDIWPVGASYGVRKLASDPPHWSDDGH